MTILELVANRQAVLSQTANTLKSRVDAWRWTSFGLSLLGATLAAVASGLKEAGYRAELTWSSALALAAAAFVTARFLSKDAVTLHVAARIASESLKREAFLYATSTPPYADAATRDGQLTAMLNAVNDGARSVALSEQKAKGQGSCPRDNLDKDQYLADRLRKQIAYYESSADKLSKPSRWLHGAEIVLAGAAALISAVAASVGKGGFDLASLTAVVTTLAGTVLAHLQAARYDEQIVNYRATALRLQNLDASAATEPSAASLAAKAEEIIAGETKGWQALWLAENKKSQP